MGSSSSLLRIPLSGLELQDTYCVNMVNLYRRRAERKQSHNRDESRLKVRRGFL